MNSEYFENLVNKLHDMLWNEQSKIWLHILKGLANGKPLPLSYLTDNLKISSEELEKSLSSLTYIEYDETGNILAAGLSITPTPFKFHINGKSLFTWCALESLMYPILLGQTATIETQCPISNNFISIVASPEKVINVNPNGAVVSMIKSEYLNNSCGVKNSFCSFVNFLNSQGEAKEWIDIHPETFITSIDEAYSLGFELAQRRLS